MPKAQITRLNRFGMTEWVLGVCVLAILIGPWLAYEMVILSWHLLQHVRNWLCIRMK